MARAVALTVVAQAGVGLYLTLAFGVTWAAPVSLLVFAVWWVCVEISSRLRTGT